MPCRLKLSQNGSTRPQPTFGVIDGKHGGRLAFPVTVL
jgi:hypothetical protein